MFRKSSSRDPIPKADIQQDWADREFIQQVQYNFVKIATFLNKFDIVTRYKLGEVYERLSHLERQMDLLENSIIPITGKPAPEHPRAERPSLMKKPEIPALQQEQAERDQEAQLAKERLERAKQAEEELLAQQRIELEKLRKHRKPQPPTAAVPPPPEEFQNTGPVYSVENDLLEPPPEPPMDDDDPPPPPDDEEDLYTAPPPPML